MIVFAVIPTITFKYVLSITKLLSFKAFSFLACVAIDIICDSLTYDASVMTS